MYAYEGELKKSLYGVEGPLSFPLSLPYFLLIHQTLIKPFIALLPCWLEEVFLNGAL